MNVKLLQALVLLFLSGLLLAAEEPAELTKLRNGYVDAHVTAVTPLTNKYLKALTNLREKLTKAGDLEAAIIVKSEEDGNNKTEEAKQPRQLIALKRIYENGKRDIAINLERKYIAALKKLQNKFTKSGDLDEALLVKAEHDKILGPKAGIVPKAGGAGAYPKTVEAFKKYIVGTAWVFSNSKRAENPLIFREDGEFSNNGLVCRYEVTGLRKVVIIWGGNTRVNCQISKDWKKMIELDAGRGTLRRVRK